jgi:large subunit ribosomal protein L15
MAKRVGRGYGSGKGGHTTGRGQKGQKARGKLHILFEGLKVKKSTLKKLPFLRGRGKFKAVAKPVIVSIKKIEEKFKKGETISVESLAKHGLINKKDALKFGVKVLGKSVNKENYKFEVKVSK